MFRNLLYGQKDNKIQVKKIFKLNVVLGTQIRQIKSKVNKVFSKTKINLI